MWIDCSERIFNDQFFLLHFKAIDLGIHCSLWQTRLGKDSSNNQDVCYQEGVHGKF